VSSIAVVDATIGMLGGRAESDEVGRQQKVCVLKAVRKLVCSFSTPFPDDFVRRVGQWLLQQMRSLIFDNGCSSYVKDDGLRAFYTLFRYKDSQEIFGTRMWGGGPGIGREFKEEVHRLLKDLQKLETESPDDHSYDYMALLLVYTHPQDEIIQRIQGDRDVAAIQKSQGRKLEAVLKEMIFFFTLDHAAKDPAGLSQYLQLLGQQEATARLHNVIEKDVPTWSALLFDCACKEHLWPSKVRKAKKWFVASWLIATLFGPKVVADYTTQSHVCQYFFCEDGMFYHFSRGLQQWHQQAKSSCTWEIRRWVVGRYMDTSAQLRKDKVDQLGKCCNWSVFVGVLGEFLAGYAWPETGVPDCNHPLDEDDRKFLRKVDSELERILSIFQEQGMLGDLKFGPFWNEAFWSLQQLHRQTGLRADWKKTLATFADEMDEVVTAFMRQVDETKNALRTAKNLSSQEPDQWRHEQSSYYQQYEECWGPEMSY